MHRSDAIDICNRSQVTLAVSTTAAATGVLNATSPTKWLLWARDCSPEIHVEPVGVSLAWGGGYPIEPGDRVLVNVPPGHEIKAIVESGTGTLRLHEEVD